MSKTSNKIDISIIVAVYNIENYVAECLESLLCQRHVQLEVICVNDASTDLSLSIIEQYATRDSRVRIVCNDINLGQASSRNIGCRLARGKYLYVVDGDDCLVEGALSKMFNIAQKNQLDLLTFDACSYWNTYTEKAKDNFQLYIRKGTYEGLYTGPELFSHFIMNNDTLGNVCLNFVRREFFVKHNLYWTEGGRFGEDSPFAIYMAANRAMCLQEVLYLIRRHEGSVTTSPMKSQYIEGQITQFIDELLIWEAKSLSEEIDLSVELYFTRFQREIKKMYRLLCDYNCDTELLGRSKVAKYFYKYFVKKIPLGSELLNFEQINKIKNSENLILYGAGNIAYDIADVFQYNNIEKYIVAVTKKEENVQVFNNKTIYELHELLDIRENGVVVIATTPRYSFNMYNYAALLGFKDIIMLHWNF
jgi:glycosyltransferase EpsJ